MNFNLQPWEHDEFIITYKDKPVGQTVNEKTGKVIVNWLIIAEKELGL